MNAPQAGLPRDQVVAFYAGLRQRLGDVAGVRGATLSHASLVRAGRGHPVTVDGAPAPDTRILMTGPGFFTTMRIPLLRGREIEERDRAGSVPVAVVSDAFVRRFLADRDPLGTRLTIGGSLPMELEIVGVAATARYGGLKREIPPVVYVPYAQAPARNQGAMTYALRTDGDPAAYAGIVRDLVHRAAAQVPVVNVRTLTDDIDRTINQEIVFARLCTAFAGLALAIACVGLYGTMSYAVERRTHELGIRLALGARRGRVVWMVLREAAGLSVLGLAIGLPVALESATLVEPLLFAVKPGDPRTFVLASAVLLCAALLAGYLPSRRASRVDPLVALRHE